MASDTEAKQFEAWFREGIDRRWVSPVVCNTHDGIVLTQSEEEEFDEGYDPCVPAIRVWGPGGPDEVEAEQRADAGYRRSPGA